MKRKELIEFALWLYEGKEKEFIEEKVDEWMKIRGNRTLPNGKKVLESLNKLRDTFNDEEKTMLEDEPLNNNI